MAGAGTGAAERMASMGRGGMVESAILPAEQGAAQAANQAVAGFNQDIDTRFDSEQNSLDNAKIGAQMQYNQAPISPSTGSTLLTLGSGVANYMQGRSYIDALKNFTSQPSGASASDWSSGGSGSSSNAGAAGNPWHL